MNTLLENESSPLGVADSSARLEDVTNDPGVRVEVGDVIYLWYDVPPILQLPDTAIREALGIAGDIWEAVNIVFQKARIEGEPLIVRFLPAIRDKIGSSGNMRVLWAVYNPVLTKVIVACEIARTASPAIPLAVYLVGLGVVSITAFVATKVVTQLLELRTVNRLVTSDKLTQSERGAVLDSFRQRLETGAASGGVLGGVQGALKTGVILVVAAVALVVIVNVIPAFRGN